MIFFVAPERCLYGAMVVDLRRWDVVAAARGKAKEFDGGRWRWICLSWSCVRGFMNFEIYVGIVVQASRCNAYGL